MTDEEQQLHELLVDLVSNTHRFAKLAGSFASDQYPRAWLRALSLLEEYGEMRISDFARLDRSSQPSATALLRKLGENGYVERRADPEDARAVRVAMTEKGRKILNDGRNEIADALVPHFVELGPEQIKKLADGLAELRSIIKTSDPS
ncbi:MarR family transcriptional regulator [Rhodococcus sp. WS1]|uniref:MarR family transcriptional regulator n=2 Tax=Rhodococcus erythropolis TaxID=1833 RepID=A0AAX3V8R3_RHOER|nr:MULTISPECIES: MarR family transcriptional regulator [Rhodococcus]MCW0193203.1 MarR family transcriptional regulator [Rhodococcus sp. (in: high G+C Gram-positive bacteria)]NRH34444.1 MarR family transcriptional regulator [Rhodococcus sp. MS13]AGT91188.1 MarR family transcriptional regulator [Rhodococcus erythropolis CCM2595]ALU72475.1 MarR family transcriptional regulator [Rhodococcus erythropolis R138]MBF7736854.1 MarR family transcriptional regulator [Rhodococcus erythropolis]